MKNHFILTIILSVFTGILVSFTGTEKKRAGKEELGRLLFFDPILSKDGTISCASCHKPEYAFSDTMAISKGISGREGVRNAPSAMNLKLQNFFFWDGRVKSLEEQALLPIENPVEMNLPLTEAVDRLRSKKKYFSYFMDIFGRSQTGRIWPMS
jgi:cytochrome c peroxidase